MKNTQENLSTLTIWSRNVTISTREPLTCAWIRADIWRQDGAVCSKNGKIVPYHRCARIPRLTVSVPDYGSWVYPLYFWTNHSQACWNQRAYFLGVIFEYPLILEVYCILFSVCTYFSTWIMIYRCILIPFLNLTKLPLNGRSGSI